MLFLGQSFFSAISVYLSISAALYMIWREGREQIDNSLSVFLTKVLFLSHFVLFRINFFNEKFPYTYCIALNHPLSSWVYLIYMRIYAPRSTTVIYIHETFIKHFVLDYDALRVGFRIPSTWISVLRRGSSDVEKFPQVVVCGHVNHTAITDSLE